MLTRDRRRTAFTLIELLVVVSIIAVLVALTATAAFGVRRNMQKQNAETTLQKLDQMLQQKMKVTRDQIQEDVNKRAGNENTEVYTILNACGGNKEQAKAVLLYARLRRDLPMTFQEANPATMANRFTVCGYTYAPSPTFASLPTTGGNTIEDSAACLYAAIAPMGLDGLEQQVGTNAAGQKVFIDGFGSPIGFVRLGYDGNGSELNNPPFLRGPVFDPFYPNKDGAGNYRDLGTDFPGGTFNAQVWNAVRPNVAWLTTPAAYPGRRNHVTFCFSAGANRLFPEPPSNGIFDGDNLFSYRLRREGTKGD